MRKFFIPLTLFIFCFFNNVIAQQDILTEKGGYSLDASEEHYFLFILNNRPNDLAEMRGEITKYIWKYHPKQKLKITQIRVEGELAEVPIIHISKFDNKAQAMEFYKNLKSKMPDFLQMGMTKDYYAVSKSNYEKIIRSQTLSGYKPFFVSNY
ncbi:MAG: hypothetical protein R2825_19930 [Saprospiraceae bacterium]